MLAAVGMLFATSEQTLQGTGLRSGHTARRRHAGCDRPGADSRAGRRQTHRREPAEGFSAYDIVVHQQGVQNVVNALWADFQHARFVTAG